MALIVTSMASLSHAASGAELHLCQSSLLPSTCYISGKVDTTSDLVLLCSQIPNHNFNRIYLKMATFRFLFPEELVVTSCKRLGG